MCNGVVGGVSCSAVGHQRVQDKISDDGGQCVTLTTATARDQPYNTVFTWGLGHMSCFLYSKTC